MKSKLLMYNRNNGELKITVATPNGSIFKKYVNEGFEPIGFISGLNMVIGGLNMNYQDHKEIYDAYNKIVNNNSLIKKSFVVTISADAYKVTQKYPNYGFNFNNPSELIYAIANDIKYIAGVDMSKDGMNIWGVSVEIKENT